MMLAEIELAADVVLDYGDPAACHQLHQGLFFVLWHQRAERIAGVGDYQAGGNAALPAGEVERFDGEAVAWVARKLSAAPSLTVTLKAGPTSSPSSTNYTRLPLSSALVKAVIATPAFVLSWK